MSNSITIEYGAEGALAHRYTYRCAICNRPGPVVAGSMWQATERLGDECGGEVWVYDEPPGAFKAWICDRHDGTAPGERS